MTRYAYHRHKFECDEPGCDAIERIEVYTKTRAVRHLRSRGWSVHNKKHYCPDHNTKPDPEVGK